MSMDYIDKSNFYKTRNKVVAIGKNFVELIPASPPQYGGTKKLFRCPKHLNPQAEDQTGEIATVIM